MCATTAHSPTSAGESPTTPCRSADCATPAPPAHWGFAIYLVSRDGYEDSFLPSGLPAGSPEDALDCACGPYPQRPHGLDPTPDELTPRTAMCCASPRPVASAHRLGR